MRMAICSMLAMGLLMGCAANDDNQAKSPKPGKGGFYSLFDGKSLDGWKASETPNVFKVEDGAIIVNGPRSHLFYVGPVHNHDFKDFHLKCEVKTWPKANSGIYFHTDYQETDWPAKGYECQVNATHSDWRKTGSLYAVQDVREAPHQDGEWFPYEVIVKGNKITIIVNGKTTVEFTQGPDYKPPQGMDGRLLSHGTFALQGHDPESKAAFRNIQVKPLD